jgi:hypothetical protein
MRAQPGMKVAFKLHGSLGFGVTACLLSKWLAFKLQQQAQRLTQPGFAYY